MAEIIYNNSIQEVLPNRFLDYSIAVLKDRAIPDGFDGLKPIHRRVLMAMHDLGLSSKTPYRKSAKTIGEVLGKYHPHGDQSAYEALVGLAQDFNMRYPLIDGSGNFGSVNGDPAAAMRYTESRLSPFGELMLEDVGKLSPTKDNFDNSAQEPITLSSYFPNLLLNPTNGIAVGLATKFAPHYAKDVYNALIKTVEYAAKDKEVELEELIDIIQAPDFPTGAQIINGEEVRNIYRTGKGPVTLRAKYRIEKNNIIYYEIPYKVTPKAILEKIALLNIADIRDVRDESSLQNGMRLVVELKKDANPEYIINRLFKDTDLQCNYNVNMVAIMGNRPKAELDLKTIVEYYLENLKGVHRKSLTIQKEELEAKIFIINTLLKAIDLIEEIIRIVRYEDEPIKQMQIQLGFTKEEAEYIFNIKISAISKANKLDLDAKKAQYEKELARLVKLLGDKVAFLNDLAKKLKSIRDNKIFKDDVRRTEILEVVEGDSLDMKDFVKKEPVVITYSTKGALKAMKPTDKAPLDVKLKDDEYLVQSMQVDTHSDLLLLSNFGKAYILPVYKIPIVTRAAAGKSVNTYLTLEDEEKIILVSDIPENKDGLSIVTVSAQGFIKRTELEQVAKTKVSLTGFRAAGLEDNDKLVSAAICGENAEIMVFTDAGRGLKFNLEDGDKTVRASGKTARGVMTMRLDAGESIAAATILASNSSVVLATATGLGKRITRKSIKEQRRTQAPINYAGRLVPSNLLVAAVAATANDYIILTTKQGLVACLELTDFQAVGRTAKNLPLLEMKDDSDYVVSMVAVARTDVPETAETAETPAPEDDFEEETQLSLFE